MILASGSPRRRELLAAEGLVFRVERPDIEERPWPGEMPSSYALRLSFEKAEEVGERVRDPDAVVIAADTIVVKGREILEKPADEDHAADMLRMLSDGWHDVITGLCVRHQRNGRWIAFGDAVRTGVLFRPLSDREIMDYIATGEPMDKAGAYAIQGGAAGMVAETAGSWTNVVGLPMERLREVLAGIRSSQP